MKLQRLYSLTRQAIEKYDLIQDGDHIAVGVSGGKDSLTLLYALQGLSKFYPKKFTVSAITVDLGYDNFDLKPVSGLCEQLSVPFTVIPTQIGKILFEARQESNPCALCAKMRRGAISEAAVSLGCNKIAYAHHMDDLIETMVMSLMYEGRFYAFPPYTYFEDKDLAVIRPMMLVSEAEVIGFQKRYQLPVCKNPCPADGHTRREYVKQLIRQLERENPGMKKRLFHSILTGNISDWPQALR
jgi:tRNA(Ile)-lysidine synthase TilS/MesJ